jgi:hypothetical protein
MIQTDIGPIDGNSWEELCQAVYKRRHTTYQEMVPSPGDWGIEGFILEEGLAIQCYCPKKVYDTPTLHSKQVDKITKDLNKLSSFKSEIKSRIGSGKIRRWIFITPSVAKNDLHSHARKKESEVRQWNLDIIDPNFQILIHDIGHYIKDFREIQSLNGQHLIFSEYGTGGLEQAENCTDYEKNIIRKNNVRSIRKGLYNPTIHKKLNDITTEKFILGDSLIRKIEKQSPELYKSLNRVINQYETEIEEISLTWEDSPKELIEKVSTQLKSRFEKDVSIAGVIVDSDLNHIVDHMISKWIALCPLAIEE